jgi:hypothetical protein
MIDNVKASVAPVAGELLLGQSFLTRFSSWSINNVKHSLVLTPSPPAQASGTEPAAQTSSTPPQTRRHRRDKLLLGPLLIYLFGDFRIHTLMLFCSRHTMLSRRDRKSQSLTIARYGQPQGGAYKTPITSGVQRYTAIIAGGLMHIS